MSAFIYGLYDDDGNQVYVGTTAELTEQFGLKYKVAFCNYASQNQKFLRKYTVKVIAEGSGVAHTYGVYDPEGELVVKGSPTTIGDFFGSKSTGRNISVYAKKGTKLYGVYTIKREDKIQVVEIQERDSFKEHVLSQVKRYGNCIWTKKKTLQNILDYLQANGCECKARHVKRQDHLSEMWVLEKC